MTAIVLGGGNTPMTKTGMNVVLAIPEPVTWPLVHKYSFSIFYVAGAVLDAEDKQWTRQARSLPSWS